VENLKRFEKPGDRNSRSLRGGSSTCRKESSNPLPEGQKYLTQNLATKNIQNGCLWKKKLFYYSGGVKNKQKGSRAGNNTKRSNRKNKKHPGGEKKQVRGLARCSPLIFVVGASFRIEKGKRATGSHKKKQPVKAGTKRDLEPRGGGGQRTTWGFKKKSNPNVGKGKGWGKKRTTKGGDHARHSRGEGKPIRGGSKGKNFGPRP